MTQLTHTSSRKRPSPDDGASLHDPSTRDVGSLKRQRTLSPDTPSASGLRLSIPGKDVPPTPPLSVKGTATMTLKLVIPQELTSHEQRMKLNRRRADAERWKPKLQRPYPKLTEIKNAYPLKLLRHYPDATACTQPNFIRPRIDKSARVSRLLGRFPLIDTTHAVETSQGKRSPSPAPPMDRAMPLSARVVDLKKARSAHVGLQANMHITGSEHAQRLAWQSFSLPEPGRIDRGREAMMLSGLVTDDLRLEAAGERNKLPDWKKPCTGRFARGRQAAG